MEGKASRYGAANMLNKLSLTADNGWFSSLRLGGGVTTPYRIKPASYEMLHCLELERILCNDLSKFL